MKGEDAIIDLLNEVLTAELTAVNQYFLDAKMCANWGYHKLAHKKREESIEEMKDAEAIMDRILYFDGIPNMQRLGKINIGENVPEILRLDLALEMEAVARLNPQIEECRALDDNATRHLLEEILTDEEEHIDWIEAQLALIEQVGVQIFPQVPKRIEAHSGSSTVPTKYLYQL